MIKQLVSDLKLKQIGRKKYVWLNCWTWKQTARKHTLKNKTNPSDKNINRYAKRKKSLEQLEANSTELTTHSFYVKWASAIWG